MGEWIEGEADAAHGYRLCRPSPRSMQPMVTGCVGLAQGLHSPWSQAVLAWPKVSAIHWSQAV